MYVDEKRESELESSEESHQGENRYTISSRTILSGTEVLWNILKVRYKRNSEIFKKYQNVVESDVIKPACVFPVHTDESFKVAISRQSEIVEPMRSPKLGNRRNVSCTANAQSEFDCVTDLMFKIRLTFFLYRHFESVALSRSPIQPSMESRI